MDLFNKLTLISLFCMCVCVCVYSGPCSHLALADGSPRGEGPVAMEAWGELQSTARHFLEKRNVRRIYSVILDPRPNVWNNIEYM